MHFEARFVMSSDLRFLPTIRNTMENLAAALGWDESDSRRITVAVEEAMTNKIRHAYHSRADGVVTIGIATTGGVMHIRLTDRGYPPDMARICAKELGSLTPGGLGTYIIREIMDTVSYETSADGNHLILTKRLP